MCLELDENCAWKPETFLNEYNCREIESSAVDAALTELDAVDRSELPTSRADLDSHINIVVA